MFAVVAFLIGPIQNAQSADTQLQDLMLLTAFSMSVVFLALAAFVPKFLLTRTLSTIGKGEFAKRLQAYQVSRILYAAFCEGPAFFWCVLALLFGPIYLVGAGVCLLILLWQFPTQSQAENLLQMRARDFDATS